MNEGTGSGIGMQPTPPSGGGYAMAQSKVAGPAIALMITAGVSLCLHLLGLMATILGIGIGAAMTPVEERWAFLLAGPIAILVRLVVLALTAIILVGAMKMRKLENYGLAMTGTIIALVPCLPPCCLLSIPFGIWALVVLMNPEVKSAFR